MYSGRLGTVEAMADARWRRCRPTGAPVAGAMSVLRRSAPGGGLPACSICCMQ